MNRNDVLRRLRYALDLSDASMLSCFKSGASPVGPSELKSYLTPEGEEGYVECPDGAMWAFLDGLIESRRGKREGAPAAGAPKRGRIGNNDILKGIRVALALKDEDILSILGEAGVQFSASGLGALFRKPGHPNYKPCGDQFLRNFLLGLTRRLRGNA